MKKLLSFLISFLFVYPLMTLASEGRYANTTEELYAKKSSMLGKAAALGFCLPCPILSTVFQFPCMYDNYQQATVVRDYFTAARLYGANKSDQASRQVLEGLLKKVKDASAEKMADTHPMFKITAEDVIYADYVKKQMDLNELTRIMNDANTTIPEWLGSVSKNFGIIKDENTLIFGLANPVTISFNDKKEGGVPYSILEDSIIRARKNEEELKSNQEEKRNLMRALDVASESKSVVTSASSSAVSTSSVSLSSSSTNTNGNGKILP